jgi:hypothetical protein
VFGLFLEILIAIGILKNEFFRGSIGDLLIIVIIYFALRIIPNITPVRALVIACVIGLLAEVLQFIHIAELLRLPEGSVMYILIGNDLSPFFSPAGELV